MREACAMARFCDSNQKRGLTLVELIVVLVAIGILAVLALRAFGVVHKTKGTVEAQNILDTVNSVQGCFGRATDFAALGATAGDEAFFFKASRRMPLA